MEPLVFDKRRGVTESPPSLLTSIELLFSMYCLMLNKIGLPTKSLPTYITHIGSLSSVCHVNIVCIPAESLPTFTEFIRLFFQHDFSDV